MARYEGIRYGFRPQSYWVDQTVRQSILRNVTGSERRRIIDQALARGQFDQIPEALAVWREMARWQAGAAAPSPKVVSEWKLAQNALRALGAPILDAVRRRASRRTGHLVLCPPSPNSTSWKDFGESHHLETLLTSVNSSCSISKSRCQPPDWWLKTPKRSNMAPSLKSSLSNSRDTEDSSNVAVTSRFFG